MDKLNVEKITMFFKCSNVWRNVNSREDEGNIEKMRLLSSEFRNIEMILYECMDNEKSYTKTRLKWYIIRPTDIKCFIIQCNLINPFTIQNC